MPSILCPPGIVIGAIGHSTEMAWRHYNRMTWEENSKSETRLLLSWHSCYLANMFWFVPRGKISPWQYRQLKVNPLYQQTALIIDMHLSYLLIPCVWILSIPQKNTKKQKLTELTVRVNGSVPSAVPATSNDVITNKPVVGVTLVEQGWVLHKDVRDVSSYSSSSCPPHSSCREVDHLTVPEMKELYTKYTIL